jgi:hypothetical protein
MEITLLTRSLTERTRMAESPKMLIIIYLSLWFEYNIKKKQNKLKFCDKNVKYSELINFRPIPPFANI